jgi:tetratricopeptide (TPR) repeat protein
MTSMKNSYLGLGLISAILFTTATNTQAQTTSSPPKTETVYSRTLKSTALIICGKSQGTCWVVSKSKKLVITNEHVIHDGGDLLVVFPVMKENRPISNREEFLKQAKPIRAKVLKSDALVDLALVELESLPETAMELRMAKSMPNPGDEVHAIGCPGGSQGLFVYSYGRVRQVTESKWMTGSTQRQANVVETQLPLNPGDSGGPLVNNRAELVGINQSGNAQAQLISYSISATELKKFVNQPMQAVSTAKPNSPLPPVEPKTPTLLYQQSAEYLKSKEWAKARECLLSLLRLDPKDVRALLDLTFIHNELGEFTKAITTATSLVRIDPKNDGGFRELGYAHLQLGHYREAAGFLATSIKLNPKMPATFDYAAQCLEKLGQKAMAAESRKTAELLRKSN